MATKLTRYVFLFLPISLSTRSFSRVPVVRKFCITFKNSQIWMRQPHFGCAGFWFPIFSQRIVFFHGHQGHHFFLSIIIEYIGLFFLYTILFVYSVSMNVFFFHGHRLFSWTRMFNFHYMYDSCLYYYSYSHFIYGHRFDFSNSLHIGQAINIDFKNK